MVLAERNAVESGVRELPAFARATRLQDIPPAALRCGVMIIADDLGAIVAACDEPEVATAHAQFERLGGPAEASVFGHPGVRLERSLAAAASGLAADWCELDEGYRKAVCHAGLYTLPALLAEAEATGASVGEVLPCAVLAYEITARFARLGIPAVHAAPAWHLQLARRRDRRRPGARASSLCLTVSPRRS